MLTKMAKKLPGSMNTERPLPCSLEPEILSYHEPVQSSPQPHILHQANIPIYTSVTEVQPSLWVLKLTYAFLISRMRDYEFQSP